MVEKFKNLDVKFQLKICLLFVLSYFSPIVGVLVFIYNFFKHIEKVYQYTPFFCGASSLILYVAGYIFH